MTRILLLLAAVAVFAVGKHQVSSKKIIACYFSNWAGYRQGQGKFEPTDIDPAECTHLLYAFANINSNLLQFQSTDTWADLVEGGGKGYYSKFNNLKQQNSELKTLLSMGGSSDDPVGLWNAAGDPSARERIISSGITFVKNYGFDGVDLNWLLPSYNAATFTQRDNIAVLITEMSEAFHEAGLLFTVSIPPLLPQLWENSTEIHAILAPGVSDFISVKTFDFHGAWEAYTHHVSPLYVHPMDVNMNVFLNVNTSMAGWVEKGVSSEQLLVSIAPSGRGFALFDSTQDDFYAAAYQPGQPGPYTQQPGFMGFNEICEIKDTIDERWQEDIQCNYGIFNTIQWWGYETPRSATKKAEYIVENNYGGASLYTLEVDDFHDNCGEGKNSIGQAIKTVFDAASH